MTMMIMNTYVYDKIYEAHTQAKIDPTKRNNVVIIFPEVLMPNTEDKYGYSRFSAAH